MMPELQHYHKQYAAETPVVYDSAMKKTKHPHQPAAGFAPNQMAAAVSCLAAVTILLLAFVVAL